MARSRHGLLKEQPLCARAHGSGRRSRLLFLAPATTGPGALGERRHRRGSTRAFTDFAPSPFAQTNFLKALGGKAHLRGGRRRHGAELWASDGTAAGR